MPTPNRNAEKVLECNLVYKKMLCDLPALSRSVQRTLIRSKTERQRRSWWKMFLLNVFLERTQIERLVEMKLVITAKT